MADSNVAITPGSGANVDVRTVENGDLRQVVVVGGDGTAANIAPVDATNGLAVDVKALPASTNTIEVVGDAAENAAASGNPVLSGGRYDSTPRTLGNGDAGAIALNASGHVMVDTTSSQVVTNAVLSAAADGFDNLGVVLYDTNGTPIVPISKAEDVLAAADDDLMPVGVVRRDAKTVSGIGDGDYTWLSTNSVGDLRVDGGQSFTLQQTVPTTAVAYTAADAVGGILTFANMSRATGAGGTLMGATLHCQSTVAANDFRVFVYSASPANGTYTDNGVWTGHDTDTDLLVDSFLLDDLVDMNTGSVLRARDLNIPYLCAATSLFVTIRSEAYTGTPAANAFKLTLHTIRD